MLFVDSSFIFVFLPSVLVVYFSTPRRWRNLVLFVFSLVFYAVSSLNFIYLLLASIFVDFVAGKRIAASAAPGSRKLWLLLSLSVNLGVLGYFKYAGLFSSTLRGLLGPGVPLISTLLPVGISFYTFQSMSYTIDVYRGRVAPARSWLDFATYVALFPQLIAGPIVRYTELQEELHARRERLGLFASGCELFILGMGKKILIADSFAQLGQPLWAQAAPGFAVAWLGMLLYAGQIYFDFAGYSDMAIGLGRMFGFQFPVNFNSPYQATSFSDFWRRWHITLSTWLRDYLYIPLGGNRRGPLRTYVNLFLTMLLGGLWHGAAWSYMLWGAMHGALLGVERAVSRWVAWRPPRIIRRALVFLAVVICWVPFKHNDIHVAGAWLRAMLLPGALGAPGLGAAAGALMVVVLSNLPKNTAALPEALTPGRAAWALLVLPVAVFFAFGRTELSPFIYFRF